MNMEKLVELDFPGENEELKENSPQCHFVYHTI
jgi:hypothetical protein